VRGVVRGLPPGALQRLRGKANAADGWLPAMPHVLAGRTATRQARWRKLAYRGGMHRKSVDEEDGRRRCGLLQHAHLGSRPTGPRLYCGGALPLQPSLDQLLLPLLVLAIVPDRELRREVGPSDLRSGVPARWQRWRPGQQAATGARRHPCLQRWETASAPKAWIVSVSSGRSKGESVDGLGGRERRIGRRSGSWELGRV
jgi:hypothetical protein